MANPKIDKAHYHWDKAPKWANWAAFTKDIEVIYFDNKPIPGEKSWLVDGMYIVGRNTAELQLFSSVWNWQDTLVHKDDGQEGQEGQDDISKVPTAKVLEKAIESQERQHLSFHSFTIRAVYNRTLNKDGFRIVGLWGDEEKFEGNRIGPFFATLKHCEQELDICLKTITLPIRITDAEKYFDQLDKIMKWKEQSNTKEQGDQFPATPTVEVSVKQFEQMDDERRASAIEHFKKNSPVMERSNPGVSDVEQIQRELLVPIEQNEAVKVVETKLDELTNLVKQLYEFVSKKNESDLIEKICQDAPDWATYHAFDENGTGAYYEKEPEKVVMAGRNVWNIANSLDKLQMSDFKKPTTMPWDKSLIKVVKNR